MAHRSLWQRKRQTMHPYHFRADIARINTVAILLLGVVLSLGAATTVRGATLCVNPGGGSCLTTIKAAVTAAMPGDIITVAAATYNEYDIVMAKSLTINGAAANTTILDAGNTTRRGFYINAGVTVTISGMTVQHGNTTGAAGGIENLGTLTLSNCAIINNTAALNGGGIANTGGTLTVNNSTFTGNSGKSGGGIANVGGGATLNNVTVNGNTSTPHGTFDGGAGLYNVNGTLTITGGTVNSNNGFAIYNSNETGTASMTITNGTINNNGGVGIENDESLALINSTVSGNTGVVYGGGIDNQGDLYVSDSTISNNTAGSGGYGGGINDFGHHLTVVDSTITGNRATNGGGIVTATLATILRTAITNNTATNGGGIFQYDGGLHTVLAFTNSTLSGNTATGKGGGIYIEKDVNHSGIEEDIVNGNIVNNTANLFGGGIYITNGTVAVVGSTLAYNVGQDGGGGIYTDTGGRLVLTNSTVSTNSLVSGGGGGIANLGNTTLIHATLAYNSPSNLFNNGGTASVANTILATTGGANFNCSAASTSLDYNLSNDTSCTPYWTQPHDLNNKNPMLGGLVNNGGPTLTHALTGSSPALNAVPAAGGCRFGIATDQRGIARPQGTGCDIGAYEAQFGPVPQPRIGPHVPGSPSPDPPHRPGPGAPGGPPAPIPILRS